MVRFPSEINTYQFVTKSAADSFETRITNNKNLSINSKVKNFRPTNLIVLEGPNNHVFVLRYKQHLSASEVLYDFSNKRKLKDEAVKIAQGQENAGVPDVSSQQYGDNAGSPEAQPGNTPANKPTYAEVKSNADNEYANGKFDKAKELYEAALVLKPHDAWSLYQIGNINQRQPESAYSKSIVAGDSAFRAQDYDQAKLEYTKALGEKSDDPYAASQLSKIRLLAKDDSYNRLMSQGRQSFARQEFNDAEVSFREALKVKPNDLTARQEIAKINPARKAFQKSQIEGNLNSVRQRQYNDSISLADKMFDVGLYKEAARKYRKADKLMPGDLYIARRMAEIDSILRAQGAAVNKRHQDSVDAIIYQSEIDRGSVAFQAQDYTTARAAFLSARSVKPDEPYPTERIEEIDRLLAEAKRQKRSTVRVRSKQDSVSMQYNSLIKNANSAGINMQYELAKDFFLQASALKPGEKYPIAQLRIIENKLAERAIEEKYDAFIHAADSVAFIDRNYAESLRWYDSAISVKPSEFYPRKQIVIVNREMLKRDSLLAALARQKERTEQYNLAMNNYQKGEAARRERRYEEAYVEFTTFMSKIDTSNVKEYFSTQQYHIRLAKDYIGRLQAYKPKPVQDTLNIVVPPPQDNNKGKKKKKNRASARSPFVNTAGANSVAFMKTKEMCLPIKEFA